MPQYILCPACVRVPVTRIGELCESCQRKADAQDKRNEAKLDRLERKPVDPKRWMEREAK